MRYPLSTLGAVLAALALGACAKDAEEYPSLAKRPAERVTAVYGAPEAPATQAPLPQPEGTVLGQLESLVAQAERGDARFRKAEPTARRLVAQAGRAKVGSEGWAQATMAVSELEAARGETMVPLAELDRIYAEAMTQGQDVTAIAAARDRVIVILGRQDQILGELRSVLGN